MKGATGKTIEVAVQKDVFCFLLTKSLELKSPVDIDEALKYLLSPVPLSIAHADGEKRKTNESALYDYALKSCTSSQSIDNLNGSKVYVLDLAALLRSTVKIPGTFEELAMKVYNDIQNAYNTIYVACDTYRTQSIKSPERRFIIMSGKV